MTENLKRSVGLRVRAARKRTGLSQENLAAAISRTSESISNIERGQQLPNLETLSELARVLGVPLAEFFEGIGEERAIPRERAELEMKLREIARSLDDRDLRIAVAQVQAFSKAR